MGLYEDFLSLGYTHKEAQILAHTAKTCNDHFADIEINEALERIVDKFNEIGLTSFHTFHDKARKHTIGHCTCGHHINFRDGVGYCPLCDSTIYEKDANFLYGD